MINGITPSGITINPAAEKITSTSTQTSGKKITTWYKVSALDNSYIKIYQKTKDEANNVYWVVGLKYTPTDDYNK